MGGACGTHGRNEKWVQKFGWKVSRDETALKT